MPTVTAGRTALVAGLIGLGALAALAWGIFAPAPDPSPVAPASPQPPPTPTLRIQPMSENPLIQEALLGDDSGQRIAFNNLPQVGNPADLAAVKQAYEGLGLRVIAKLEPQLKDAPPELALRLLVQIGGLQLFAGQFARASATLARARALVQTPALARHLPDVVFLQAVAALRTGEVDNCVAHHCRTSCILPIDRSAVHGAPAGSREAIAHLERFLELRPGDPPARWLLNIAYMTLGEFPDKVPARWRLAKDTFTSKLDVPRFRDVAAEAGLARVDQAGGAIMDDFDNDGLLDVMESTSDETLAMTFYKNVGGGHFEERRNAGLDGQYGGLTIMQTDYDNDGWLDVWVPRAGWRPQPVRPSLLRNNRDGTFSDVTTAAKLRFPMASQASAWGDYDNDGWLDLFCGGEKERDRLYHNKRDGTFEEVALAAGVAGGLMTKGAAWGDYDRDGWPDLVVNNLTAPPVLFHNMGDGTFVDVAREIGIHHPQPGFSCWWWDYDDDGWPDLYLSDYSWSIGDTALAMMGEPNGLTTGRLYRNVEGKRFEDVTARIGLDVPIVPMGSNFLDVDNDGWLDAYFGTGSPPYSMLMPNRLFKNVDGKRFVDVSYASGTAHLQKGHEIACGDFDRDGDVDIFAQLGGAVPGDAFANALFQNPGHGNHHLTVKLEGRRTNRAAIGARIEVVLAGGRRLHRAVSRGSSFGGNALEQTIGLGRATAIDRVEVFWPVGKSTQVIRDVPLDAAILVVEGESAWRPHPHRAKR